MLFEELQKLESIVFNSNVDAEQKQRFYEVCEAYFVSKFIAGISFGDKRTIEKILTELNVAQYICNNGVLEDDLYRELGLDKE